MFFRVYVSDSSSVARSSSSSKKEGEEKKAVALEKRKVGINNDYQSIIMSIWEVGGEDFLFITNWQYIVIYIILSLY